MIWHPAYDIIQVIPRIDIMVPACRQQGADNCHVLCCLVISTEKIVLPAQRDGTYFILRKIIQMLV